ncbi:hypothetical protein C0989_000952 [Termitomyces sp. Mn162]|nr:hypothetical protein C0989_000952 [Termitomyces sp. Mn162]
MAYQPANTTPKATPSTSNTPATSSPSNSIPAPTAKPADKGKAPEQPATNEQLPVAKEPVAQPLVHPFSSIPSCYAPPANRNFVAPDRTINGSNAATAKGLISDQAQVAFVDPVEAYIDLLPLGEEPVVLTVAKDPQLL